MPNFKKQYPPEIFREIRNQQRRKNYAKTAIYGRSSWSKEDDEAVLAHLISDRELSEKIHHSVQAIQNRRYKIKNGKLKEEG